MNVNVTLDNETRVVESGIKVGELAGPSEDLPYIAAMVNNNLSSLSYPLTVNCEVRFLTMADPHGWRAYRRSLCFILAKAVRDVFPESVFSIDHSMGISLYCSFRENEASEEGISEEQLKSIEVRMREIVEGDIAIERRKVSYNDAVDYFEESGQQDKLNLLKHRNPPRIVTYWCDGFSDLAHGPLAPATGVLSRFALIHYQPGFILNLPGRSAPAEMEKFQDQPHLFNIFQEHKEWGRIIGVDRVGKLNEIIARGEIKEIVRTIEALHEKKMTRIADRIAESRNKVKLVLIAGPSCAGKTTFAKRLTTHLLVNGIRTVTLGTDDYFVGEERNPVDEDGNPDYEHLEAVDLDLFNSDLLKIVNGEAINIPRFNFETKAREYDGKKLQVGDDQMVIIEGIHGLNPRLTEKIPSDCEFKIYVSALTQLSVDSNNRISTTDNRLMRRLVRDHRFRGHSPLDTLRIWPSVRRGEKKWIFPFQREAHATFNSALDYELAVLKPMVEPLLMLVKPSDVEYAEARRLSEFLLSFLSTSSSVVPRNSILREYIGGSGFSY